MLKKVKDVVLRTRMAGGISNRCRLISIATGVFKCGIFGRDDFSLVVKYKT